jgi:hypothetical protein
MHSPVINDTTFHSALVLKILLKMEAIETAYLYGDLEEKLWMDLPDVYVDYIQELNTNGKQLEVFKQEQDNINSITTQTHCFELKKAIYGLVQAARQLWKKFKEVTLQMGFKPSLADPCLFYRDKPTRSFIIIYVDDGGIFSDEKTIQEVL